MPNFLAESFIRLRPDLFGFRAETQAQLNASLAALKIPKLPPIALPILTVGAAAAGAGIASAISSAADFEAALNALQATSEATDEEMQALSKTAKDLGADVTLPAVSAADAANALGELVKAGLSVEEAIDGAKGVLQLATAANLDVATSASIAANALNAFRLDGTEAARVADLLAGASAAAQGEIGDFGAALQQSAAAAAQVGVPIEDAVAALTLLARSGIQGSDAGTSLRTTLLRLVPTTKEAADTLAALGVQVADQQGNLRPLADIFEDYRRALAQLPPVQRQAALTTIFGTDAFRAASVFASEGARGFAEVAVQVEKQGRAAEIAAGRTRGLRGALDAASSAADTLGITVGNVTLGPLTEFVETGTDAILVANRLAETFGGIAEQDLAFGIDIGDVARFPTETILSGGLAIRGLRFAIEELRDSEEEVVPVTERLGDSVRKALTGLASEFQAEGKRLGENLGSGIGDGIDEADREAINAARRLLADVRREGAEQIEEAIRSARENFEGLGDDLSADVVQLLDAGPVGRAIEEIDRKLEELAERQSRRSLGFDLTQAETDLREAREAIAQVGQLTPEQRRSQEEFLKPFREKVADAKAAVKEFDLSEHREDLQTTLEKQRQLAEDGITRLIDRFDDGRLSVDAFNRQLTQQLNLALDALQTKAGKNLGLSFSQDFLDTLAAVKEQASALAGFTGGSATAPGPRVLRPAETVSDVQRQTFDAIANLAQVQKDAKKQAHDDADRIAHLLITLPRRLGVNTTGPSKFTDRR